MTKTKIKISTLRRKAHALGCSVYTHKNEYYNKILSCFGSEEQVTKLLDYARKHDFMAYMHYFPLGIDKKGKRIEWFKVDINLSYYDF
jgi:hypothetical protein